MCKKISIFLIAFFATYSVNTNAQVLSNGVIVDNQIFESNAFLDASTNFGTPGKPNLGVGLVFPSVNLVEFQFDLNLLGSEESPFTTFFDGMIVYNNYTGDTKTEEARSSTSTSVVPGFYYFIILEEKKPSRTYFYHL